MRGNSPTFRYRGYFYDTETGWYYLQSRYYLLLNLILREVFQSMNKKQIIIAIVAIILLFVAMVLENFLVAFIDDEKRL